MAQDESLTHIPNQPDYSILDKPEVLRLAFYPRRIWTSAPPEACDYMIPVEQNVSVSSRFYPAVPVSPNILYFHGNGEVACNYDSIASIYNQCGMGLFVPDYRGYGQSDGTPTFTDMAADADAIFRFFLDVVQSKSSDSRVYVMGRSLGGISALDIAYRYQKQISGLIVESGVGNAARFALRLGFSSEPVEKLSKSITDRNHSIKTPALVIHGELDSLIPVRTGIELHDSLGSKQKRLVIIPGADHNDLMMVGINQYFSAIRELVFSS